MFFSEKIKLKKRNEVEKTFFILKIYKYAVSISNQSWGIWFYNIFARRLFDVSYMKTTLKRVENKYASVWKNM